MLMTEAPDNRFMSFVVITCQQQTDVLQQPWQTGRQMPNEWQLTKNTVARISMAIPAQQ